EQNRKTEKPKNLKTIATPDLILIDGGLGHLHATLDAINRVYTKYQSEVRSPKSEVQRLKTKDLGLKPVLSEIPILGLAKRLEEIYIPTRNEPIILSRDSKALHLLQRIRDEAHRFAITYHRQLRKKRISKSLLDEMAGIGEEKKLALLHHFGSVAELKKATIADLQQVPGIGKKLAAKLHAFLTAN
ncbi:MAG: helix-hairpin-helix domain-containing protein, partial [bacterium]